MSCSINLQILGVDVDGATFMYFTDVMGSRYFTTNFTIKLNNVQIMPQCIYFLTAFNIWKALR